MDDQTNQADQIRRQLPPFTIVLTTGMLLGLVGWIGLFLVVILTVPTLGPRWLMYFLVTLAISGTFLPIMHYLHKRFPSKPAATSMVLVREALFFGVYADVLLWLQFGRALNFAEAAFIAMGLLVIEILIRWRERVTWTPPRIDDDSPNSLSSESVIKSEDHESTETETLEEL